MSSFTDAARDELIKKIKQRGEKAIVYDWVDKEGPAFPKIPAKKVLWMSQIARRAYLRERREHTSWSDEEIRTKIIQDEDVLSTFVKSHKTIFETFTSREIPQEYLLKL